VLWLAAVLFAQDDSYSIAGRTYRIEREFAPLPASGRITLEAADRPVNEVCDELSRQAGFRVEWGGDKEKKVSISADRAPLLAVLAELGKLLSCTFCEYSSAEGPFFKLKDGFFDAPILDYSLQGPLILLWHGQAKWEEYNFEDPQKPHRRSRLALTLIKDPRGHSRPGDGQAPRDVPVRFTSDGAARELKSEHLPDQFSSNGPTWQFEPRAELGAQATIDLTLPFYAPSSCRAAALSLAEPETRKEGEVYVTLESFEKEAKELRDPKDVFRKIPGFEYRAKVFLLHADATLADKLRKQKREPTAEELKRLERLNEGGGALAAHDAYFLGPGGARVPVRISSADGMSGPSVGYRYVLTLQTADESFRPERLELVWAQDYEKMSARFSISRAPLK
jgi:hypothetical protein